MPNAFANLGGCYVVAILAELERVDAMTQSRRRHVISISRRHQHFELLEHRRKRPRLPIIPSHDPFCRITSAKKSQIRFCTVSRPAFPRDLDKQATIRRSYGESGFLFDGCQEQLQAFFEGDAGIALMREFAWKDE